MRERLEKEKSFNEKLKKEHERKLTGSQPIKIVEPAEGEDDDLDFVKDSFEIAGNFKRDEF